MVLRKPFPSLMAPDSKKVIGFMKVTDKNVTSVILPNSALPSYYISQIRYNHITFIIYLSL